MSFSAVPAAEGQGRGSGDKGRSIRIGDCLIHFDLNLVRGPDGDTLLEAKTIAVLAYLADRPGTVVMIFPRKLI